MRTTTNINATIPTYLHQQILEYIAKKYPMASFSRALAEMLAQAMRQDKKENE